MNRTARIAARTLAASLAIVGAATLVPQPASASVTSASAALSCGAGVVRVYPPAQSGFRSTSSWKDVFARGYVWRWNGTAWVYYASTNPTTTWWAQGAVNQNGYLGSVLGQTWVRAGSGMGLLFAPISVPTGYYYAVTEQILDTGDNTIATITNRLDVSNPNSGYYCRA